MPRLVTDQSFLVGFIASKMDDLSVMLNELESTVTFTARELQRMRDQLAARDAAIRQQHRAISDPLVRPKLTQYETMWRIALDYLKRREENDGRPVEESEARRAARLRSPDLEAYASDGDGPVPLEVMTVTTMVNDFRPVDADDLRQILTSRRAGGTLRDLDASTTADGRPRLRRDEPVPERPLRSRDGTPPGATDRPLYGGAGTSREVDDRPLYGGGEDRPKRGRDQLSRTDSLERPVARVRTYSGSTMSLTGSTISRASYASSYQQIADRPVDRVAFPPVQDELPYPISANDTGLLGLSEIYTHPPDEVVAGVRPCPLCNGGHRIIRCPTFVRLTLLDRWFQALSLGVCLNCLRRGHSSFTCYLTGSCRRCNKRHNSLLCPRQPAN